MCEACESRHRRLLKTQLSLIEDAVKDFGSALHALDRGYESAMEHMEAEGHDKIRAAFRNAPELKELLPELWANIAAEKSVANDGYDISAAVRRARRMIAEEAGGA